MRLLLGVAATIDRLNEWVARIVIWLVLVMIIVGFTNAVLRYSGRWLGMNLTTNMTVEAQWYMFSLVFLLLAGYTLYRDSHVRVDVIYARRSLRARAWIDLLGGIFFMLPFCVLIVYVSLPFVQASIRVMEVSPDPGGLPRWPIKLAIPLGFSLLTLQGVSLIIHSAARITGAEPPSSAEDR
jgi:TRAP-type mannitol/chloroaromatic compound transport system permease small subunit